MTAREEAHFFDVLAKLRSGDREALKELAPPGMLLVAPSMVAHLLATQHSLLSR